MDQIKRQRVYEGGNGTHERITIDFNQGPVGNLNSLLVAAQPSLMGNKVAVTIQTTNCTGIAGSVALEQTMNDSGTPSIPYAAAISLALAPSGLVHAGIDSIVNMTAARPVLKFNTFSQPTAGRMVIDIVTKF